MAHVTIRSKETIKPSQPTPKPSPCIPLSLLDQLSTPIYTHMLFFYSAFSPNTKAKLNSSLSQTLNHFYPLAGRIRETGEGKLHVECNDDGVEFVESWVTGATLESIRKGPAVDLFNELLPVKKSMLDCLEGGPLLAVQMSVLDGGEFVLGVSICHLIADGVSLSLFLNCWSRTACGFDQNLSPPPQFDCASVFPPKEITQSTLHKRFSKDNYKQHDQDVVIRCFAIDSTAIERLKQAGGGQSTRVEAVSALVWRCIKRAQGENRSVSMSHVVNFRKIMAPMLSNESFGNMWVRVETAKPGREADSSEGVEQQIRRATRGVDGEYVRRKAEQQWEEREGRGRGKIEEARERPVEWIFSSVCRMGWYACDFGCGEPAWVAFGMKVIKNICMLIDAKDGHGMEVWLWMAREEMVRIESDHEFIQFVGSQQEQHLQISRNL